MSLHSSPSHCLLRWKRRLAAVFPVAESFGVLLGVLGFDLVAEGRADLPKALLATAVFAAVVTAWRLCPKRPRKH